MPHALSDPLLALDRGLDLLTAALRETDDLAGWAAGVAGALRALVPDGLLFACRLTRAGKAVGRAVDRAGTAQPDAVLDEAAAGQMAEGRRWFVREVETAGQPHGLLAVALPEKADGALVERLLGVCARQLALCLELDAERRERAALQEALGEQTWLANLGALASPMTHEFNNFLNVALLQVAVLEQEFPGKRRGEFQVIRQQGKSVAELVRQWQQYRHRQQGGPRPLDVNALVRATVAALAAEEPGFGEARIGLAADDGSAPGQNGVRVRLSLSTDLPPVLATLPDLQRLVRFLVTNAAAAITSLPGFVTIRTEQAGGKVVLTVEDTGPTVAADLLPQLFEPLGFTREGPNRLEMAACRTLVQRRLQGGITAENRPGGVAVVVTLKPFA